MKSKSIYLLLFILLQYSYTYSQLKLKKIQWHGFEGGEIEAIDPFLLNKPPTFFQKVFRRYPVYAGKFREIDLKTIRKHIADKGFIDCEVQDSLVKQNNQVILHYYLKRNTKYLVGKLEYHGNKFHPIELLMKNTVLREGKTFSPKKFSDDSLKISELYQNSGFLDISVKLFQEQPDTNKVDVRAYIDEGKRYKIREIQFTGNKEISKWLIRRELEFKKNEFFSFEEISKSRNYLFELGFFTYVNITPVKIKDTNLVDLKVKVNESKTHTVQFEFNYGQSTDYPSNFDFTADYIFRNLFKNAWYLKMSPSYSFNIKNLKDYQSFRFDLLFLERWFFAYRLPFSVYPNYSYVMERFYKKNDNEVYVDTRRKSYGMEFHLRNRMTRYGYLLNKFIIKNTDILLDREELEKFSGENRENIIENLEKEGGEGWHNGVETILDKDTRDNIFLPSKGSYFNIRQKLFGLIFGGQNDYYKLEMNWSRYKKNFNARLKIGYGASLKKGYDFPREERFYGGGVSTWRGFADRSIGYYDEETNINIGGKVMILGNFIYHLWTYRFLRQIVFIDTGNIYKDENNIDLTNIRTGVGTGLHLITPIGPLRFELGHSLNRKFGSKTIKFHLALMPMY